MIQGLHVLQEFVTEQEALELVQTIDQQQWCGRGISPNPELLRRTQQYGYLFLYRTRTVVSKLDPLPIWSQFVIERLQSKGFFQEKPNHLLINEYDLKQGIMPHIDSGDIFGDTVTSLSLLSPCVMTFQHKTTQETQSIILEPRSMLVMTDALRYEWQHSISKLEEEQGLDLQSMEQRVIQRDRRVSLTLRLIKQEALASVQDHGL
ncbi:hypothetical protein EDD86DRAFT_187693 [Gorgonomyces haynaldii]|nr:hypothetical protein EDD86DRAFT_187693 [Gorgonomyces haynaldii]